jgi:D-alanine-D-alanine ligase
MAKKKIAVVMGGYSGEFEVSMGSGQIVFDNLNPEQFDRYKVVITKDEWYADTDEGKRPISRHDFSFTSRNGTVTTFDAAFVAVHGSPAEDGKLPAYFDLIGLPHSTSNHFASALTFNKAECNMVLKSLGIMVPKSIFISRGENTNHTNIVKYLGLPLFVKPNCSGSSLGVSKVKTTAGLKSAMVAAYAEDHNIVLESAINGTEIACGVSNINGIPEAFAITEIVPKNEFFDYESKYSGLSEEITPARISDELTESIKRQAEMIYNKLNLSGLARVDYIIDRKGQPFLIEVNTVPGLSAESILPKQAKYLGISLSDLFGKSVENCINKG